MAGQLSGFKTKLQPQTVTEFQAYTTQVESQLQQRWTGKAPLMQVDEDPAALRKVMSGDLWVHAELQHSPKAISEGLIHDWYGSILIRKTTLAKVLAVLEDFDRHSSLYPNISKSKLMKKDGHDTVGYWRIEEKGKMLPAVFDVTMNSHYQEIAPDKWFGISHSNDIQAVEKGQTLPPGEGMGLMWRLYSYWTMQQIGNDVIAECRSVSLSRGIPASVAWIIRPFVSSIPKESMDSTLRNTRRASGE